MPGGQQINVGQGLLTPRRVIQSAQGNVGVNIRPTNITSQVIAGAQGIVQPLGLDVTANISGVEAEFAQGIVAVGPVLSEGDLAGISLTASQGSITTSRERALSGSAASATPGNVSSGQFADDTFIASAQGLLLASSGTVVPLSGLSATVEQGDVLTADADDDLIGQAATLEAGTLIYSRALELIGSSMVAEQYSLGGVPITLDLTGQEIAVQQGAFTNDLIGQVITVETGIVEFSIPIELTGLATIVTAGVLEGIGGVPAPVSLIDMHDGDGGQEQSQVKGRRKRQRKDDSIRRKLEELFERADPGVRETVREIVAPHIDAGAPADAALPVSWSSLRADLEAVRALMEIYQQQSISQKTADAIEEEEAIELLLM